MSSTRVSALNRENNSPDPGVCTFCNYLGNDPCRTAMVTAVQRSKTQATSMACCAFWYQIQPRRFYRVATYAVPCCLSTQRISYPTRSRHISHPKTSFLTVAAVSNRILSSCLDPINTGSKALGLPGARVLPRDAPRPRCEWRGRRASALTPPAALSLPFSPLSWQAVEGLQEVSWLPGRGDAYLLRPGMAL